MKTFLTAAAFAVALTPAIANAATFFDPGADNASPTFVTVPAANPANAAAAAADAQRYNQVDGAVVGTHGASPRTVVEYDPGADAGTNLVTKTVLPGAAPQIAQPQFAPYADNGDLIGN